MTRLGLRRAAAAMTAVVAGSALVAGCSDDEPKGNAGQAKWRIPFKERVVITKSGFHPREAEVFTGGSITWINRDPDALHTAETDPGRYDDLPGGESASFDTHALSWNEPYTVTFHKPGTYRYHSSYDLGWEGKVSVIDRLPPRR